MMMTKPAPEAAATTKDDDTRSNTNMTAEVKKKASPEDAVKDLEKRLELLGQAAPAPAAPTLSELKAATPAPAPPAAAAAAPKTGKADLLARIMAAQERAKQPAAPAAAPDLLDGFDAPAESESAPPPPFDVSLLPAQTPAPPPPAFDATTLPPPAAEEEQSNNKQQSVSWDPNVTVVDAAPPAASAPVFEDLLDGEQQQEDQKLPPPSYNVTPVAPPSSTTSGMDQEAIDAILGIEGLSDEEKAALIAEQEKIMASIEQQKQQNSPASAGGAAARADAFEQRSHAAAVQAIGNTSSSKSAPRTVDLGDGNEVALHGQKKTFEAIKDGTAVLVQCLSCENWMQVTGKATMMFCPVCQTVSPVASADDKAAASQMASDMELAEQLQKEEYKKAEKRQAAQRAKKKAEEQAPQQQEGSWMEWLGFGAPAPAPPAGAPPSFAQKPVERGEIGVSLPPGASRNNTALAMAPAYTGQEDDSGTPAVAFSSSRDESVDSDVGPAGGSARVAQQQPLFNCVADSISSAATQMYNTLSQDEQGNVHGVDTQGLLAVSQAGRETNNNSEGAGYQNMNQK